LKQYGKSLFDEAGRRLGELSGTKTVSVYFGGGSPTSMDEDFFRNFAGFAEKSGINLAECEVTVEVNPADRGENWIKNLKNCGINRVSIGIQAFPGRQRRKLDKKSQKLRYKPREHRHSGV